LEEEMEYIYSKNHSRIRYEYSDGSLVQKSYKMDYGQASNTLTTLEYQEGVLRELRTYESEKLLKRMTFTYSEGLPSAAILRNIEDKEIKIYHFRYTFY
jgi:hypothetical protein